MQMATAIRDVIDGDYEALAAIATACGPEPVDARDLKERDQRLRQDANVAFFRLVGLDAEGRVVCYAGGACARDAETDEWSITVKVHPDHRLQGHGSALLEAAEARAREAGARAFRSEVRGEDEEAWQCAQRRGYVLERERTESVLDLTTFDRSRFDGVLEQVRSSGFQLVTYEQLPKELLPEVYQVDLETLRDHPEYDERDVTYGEFLRRIRIGTKPLVWGMALDGERVCGYSVLLLPTVPGESAYTGYTCMRREYRGRKLALACKLLTIDAALARGVTGMRTNNNPENKPMLAINEQLGYRLVPGPRLIQKRLQTS